MLYYLLSNSNYISQDENKLIRVIVIGTIIYLIVHGLVISETRLNKYFFVIVGLDIASIYMLNNNNNGLTISKRGNHSDSNVVPVNMIETDSENNINEHLIQMHDFSQEEMEEEPMFEEQNEQYLSENEDPVDDNDLINQLLQHNDDVDVETPKIKEIDDLSNDDDDEIDYSDFERSL